VRPSESSRWPQSSLPYALAAVALAAITFVATGDSRTLPLDPLTILARCEETRLPGGGQFTIAGLLAWAGSIAFGMLAFWERDAGTAGRSGRHRAGWHQVSVLAALVAGGCLLFWRLDRVPLEMTSDHAEKLLDAQFILDGHWPVFFPCNTGREAFQFYWIAALAPFTGLTYLTMKVGTALLGWLALPFTYLFARTLGGPVHGLLALGVLVTMRWHWQVSRVGLRFPFPPLFAAAIFYLLMRAVLHRRRNDFLLCGLALGVAQHTYTSLRLAPATVLACVGIALVRDLFRRDQAEARRIVINTVLLFFVTGLVSVPLARYAFDQPVAFFYRGASRIASDALTGPPPNLELTFLNNVKNAFLMFNVRGDTVWVNTIPEQPILDPVTGALFLAGAVCLVYAVLRRRRSEPLYVAAMLFCGLVPSILSLAYPGENPSTVRTGMAIPVVAYISAAPLAEGWALLRRYVPWRGAGAAGAVVALTLLGAMLSINYRQYFETYADQHTRNSQQSSLVAGEIREFLAAGGRKENVFLLPGSHWVDWRLVAIQAGDIKWRLIVQDVEAAVQRESRSEQGQRLFVVHPGDAYSLQTLERWFPAARRVTHKRIEGDEWFVTVTVPAGAAARRIGAGA